MKHARRGHTAFALTRSAVNDGGKLTKQFFRGTRATSAVEEGFLGAIFRRYGTMRQSVIFKIKEGRSLEFSISPGPQLVDSAIRGHRSLSPECSSPSRPAVVLRTEGCSSPYHVPTPIRTSNSQSMETRLFFGVATRFGVKAAKRRPTL